ncbi:MAG: hypothetical protein AAF384_04850 [Pseudomonadota bacterium]
MIDKQTHSEADGQLAELYRSAQTAQPDDLFDRAVLDAARRSVNSSASRLRQGLAIAAVVLLSVGVVRVMLEQGITTGAVSTPVAPAVEEAPQAGVDDEVWRRSRTEVGAPSLEMKSRLPAAPILAPTLARDAAFEAAPRQPDAGDPMAAKKQKAAAAYLPQTSGITASNDAQDQLLTPPHGSNIVSEKGSTGTAPSPTIMHDAEALPVDAPKEGEPQGHNDRVRPASVDSLPSAVSELGSLVSSGQVARAKQRFRALNEQFPRHREAEWRALLGDELFEVVSQ